MQALELKVPPPIAAVLAGGAMWVAARLLPAIHLAGQRRLLPTAICAVCGVIVALLGFSALHQANTTINPVNPERASSLVTSGIYRYTRNPMYVGLTALLVAWTIWLSVPWVIFGPAVFMLYLTRFQIIPEERAMSSKFGRDYDEYRRRVRRWL
jgi:protein-S-isoprenylcysteine O-methyltransferase Ste14